MDWEKTVLSAVREVISHPFGGKVEVFVKSTDVPGRFRIKPVVFFNGRIKPESEVDIAD